jgi:hypothetical protein
LQNTSPKLSKLAQVFWIIGYFHHLEAKIVFNRDDGIRRGCVNRGAVGVRSMNVTGRPRTFSIWDGFAQRHLEHIFALLVGQCANNTGLRRQRQGYPC